VRCYRLLKVRAGLDDAEILIVSRDYQDIDMWAVIARFPYSEAGRVEARAYIAEVSARQVTLAEVP
jgi:hypothetical protein